jgi:hypothetical protein
VPSYSALSPVSAALFTVLNVTSMTTLATGGVGDDVSQRSGFPFLLFRVSERTIPTLGTRPGNGRMSQCEVRLHAYASGESWKVAQDILAKAIELLATAPTVSGFSSPAIFHDDSMPIEDVEIAGEKVKELFHRCTLIVEEAA